jgi:acetyl-CoA C-acetyltransferase
MWPHTFSRIGDEYARRYGFDHRHVARLAEKAFANAKKNPLAQTRGWEFGPGSFDEDDAKNPVVEGRVRRQDCSQLTDGGAALLVCSEPFARRYVERRGLAWSRVARVLGWGHTTNGLPLEPKLAASRESPYVLPQVRRAIEAAFRRAGLSTDHDEGVRGLDGIETHDCFTITEYMAIDHFGITRPGDSWKAIEDGAVEMGGRIPINPSGGLVGVGHPVGATGVRMVLDAARQVTGTAGANQVEGARTFGTLNLGGSAGTVVSFVVGQVNS